MRDHIFATFGNVYIGFFSAVINSFHRGYTKYEEFFNTNYIYQLYKYIYYININTNYKDTTLTEYLYEPRFFTIFFINVFSIWSTVYTENADEHVLAQKNAVVF